MSDSSHSTLSSAPSSTRASTADLAGTAALPQTDSVQALGEKLNRTGFHDTPPRGVHNSAAPPNTRTPAEARSAAAFEMETRRVKIPLKEFMTRLETQSNALDDKSPLIGLPQGSKLKLPTSVRKNLQDKNTYLGGEKAIYPLLCSIIQHALDAAAEKKGVTRLSLQVCDTGDSRVSSKPGERTLYPDLSVYRKEYQSEYERKGSTSIKDQRRKKWLGRVRWALMLLFVEVKAANNNAAFSTSDTPTTSDTASPSDDPKEPDDPFDSLSDKNIQSRGQLAEYAGELFHRQHRCHAFSVSVWRDLFWLIRWDKSGVVMTDTCNYREDPLSLYRFFYLVGQMSDTQLGWDPSVRRLREPADEALIKDWESAVKDLGESHYIAQRIIDHQVFKSPVERFEVTVNPETLETADKSWKSGAQADRISGAVSVPRRLLIGRCEFSHRSHTGRGTRGFIALDVKTKTFVFLKDSWRIDYTDDKGNLPPASPAPEMVIYARLHESNVTHIPQIVCGGDVYTETSDDRRRQRTMNHDKLRNVRPHVHTRIVFVEVGKRLADYKNSKELVTILRDAVKAHKEALHKAGYLHRDLSSNNIVYVVVEGNVVGLLIDWDLCKHMNELNRGASNHTRSGTWEYLSAVAACYPRKPYRLSDDLESFILVIQKMGARFHLSNLSGDPAALRRAFEPYICCVFKAGVHCASQDRLMLTSRGGALFILEQDDDDNSPAFVSLLQELNTLLSTRYSKLNLRALKARYGPSEEPINATAVALDDIAALEDLTHDHLLNLFDNALEKGAWIEEDKIDDQMPSYQTVTAHSNWVPGVSQSRLSNIVQAARGPKRELDVSSTPPTGPDDSKRPRLGDHEQSRTRSSGGG